VLAMAAFIAWALTRSVPREVQRPAEAEAA
jgi:hypothetical protein